MLVENESAILISETSQARIMKFYLSGEKKGKREVFLNLHGLPDNLHLGSDNLMYVALADKRDPFLEKYVK